MTDLSAAPVVSGEEVAFTAAIVAAPDDDVPRLVFADWLEEHGQADRARFIRQQCEVASRPPPDNWPGWRLARDLPTVGSAAGFGSFVSYPVWNRFGDQWCNFVYDSPVVVIRSARRDRFTRLVAYHRGFPAVVGCTERQWHKHHRSFPGPLVAVCLTGRGGCWGSYLLPSGRYGLVSLLDSSLDAGDRSDDGHVTAARYHLWPRVREFAGPCTLGRLRDLAAGRRLDGVDGT